jgi:chromosome segregation ATPase
VKLRSDIPKTAGEAPGPARLEQEKAAAETSARLAALLAERDALEAEVSSLRPLREELAKTQKEVAEAREQALAATRERDAHLETARYAETTIRNELGSLQAKHVDTENRLANATRQIAALQKEREELSANVAREHQAGLEAARKSEEALKAEITALQTKYSEADAKIAKQTADMDALRKNLTAKEPEVTKTASLRDQIGQLETQLARSHDETATLQKKLTASDSGISLLREELESLRRERDELQIDAAASWQSSVAGVAAAREETEQLRQQIAELTTSLDSAKAGHEQAATLALEGRKLIDRHTKEATATSEELGRLREELKTGGADRERLNAALEKAAAEARELQGQLAKANSNADARNRELTGLRNDLAAKTAEAKGYGTQIATLNAKAEGLAKLASDKERAADQSTSQAGQLRALNAELQAKLDKSEQRCTATAAQMKTLGDETTRLSNELAAKTSALETLQLEFKALRSEMEQRAAAVKEAGQGAGQDASRAAGIEADRDALRSELEGVKSALERSKQHVSVLQARRDLLRDEIGLLRARLGMGARTTTADANPIAK